MKLFHFSIYDSNVRVGHGVCWVVVEGVFEVLDGFLIFFHVFVAASSVMVENGIFGIEFNCFSEFETGLWVILEFIIDDSEGVVDGWEFGVVFEEVSETVKGLLVLGLSLIVEAKVIQAIDVFGLKLKGHEVVVFLLLVHSEFLITHGSVVVKLIVPLVTKYFTWVNRNCHAIISSRCFVIFYLFQRETPVAVKLPLRIVHHYRPAETLNCLICPTQFL